jgi:hypothetical protein
MCGGMVSGMGTVEAFHAKTRRERSDAKKRRLVGPRGGGCGASRFRGPEGRMGRRADWRGDLCRVAHRRAVRRNGMGGISRRTRFLGIGFFQETGPIRQTWCMCLDGVLRAAVFGNTVISMRRVGRAGSP